MLRSIGKGRYEKLVVDCPRQFRIDPLREKMGEWFPKTRSVSYVSSHLARRRALLLCWKDGVERPPEVNGFPSCIKSLVLLALS